MANACVKKEKNINLLEYNLGIYTMYWSCWGINYIKIEHKKLKVVMRNIILYVIIVVNFRWKSLCENKHILIKHTDNYHSINKDKKDPGYVICPVCFEDMK